MKNVIKIIFCILIVSCSNAVDIEDYLNSLEINLTGDYKVVKNSSSSAIGDFIVEIELKLGEVDYQNIVRQVKNHATYTELDSLDHYPFGQENNPWNEKRVYACFRNGTYYRHLYVPDSIRGGGETYTLYLRPDSLLFFQYVEE
jgi:hypothetical protein